jgi:hypothetical protein
VAVDDDVGGAAAGLVVVDVARDERDLERLGPAHLVVVDEHAAVAAAADERGSAVGIGRRRRAGVERGDAGLRDDRVLEALGEREQPGRVVHERAVAGAAVPAVRDGG